MRALPGLLALALSACAAPSRCDPVSADSPPANAIDAAIAPRLAASGIVLTRATDDELCRRIAIDLTGAAPTPEEVERCCRGRSPDEMAQAFEGGAAYPVRERRLWAQAIGESAVRVWAGYLIDADPILDGLARGQLGYDDFAARLAAHPVVAIWQRPPAQAGAAVRYYPEDAADHAIRIFWGRAPVGDEADDLANLFRPWRPNPIHDPDLLANQNPEYQALIDPAACADPLYGAAACTSTELGPQATVSVPLDGAAAYEDLAAGGALPDDLLAQLEKPGRLLAARDEFWDQAADRALARLLGWWRASRSQPDSDLPEARAALSSWFRAQPGHDLRDLYRQVISSSLYTARAAAPDALAADAPPWALGPSRTMVAEEWLDSLAAATGRGLGGCDPHTDEPPWIEDFFPARYREPLPAVDTDLDGWDYFAVARALGGCRGGAASSPDVGLAALLAQGDAAPAACHGARLLLPAGVSASAPLDAAAESAIAANLFSRFVARAPTASEQSALDDLAAGCASDPSCGVTGFAEAACGALARSAAFLER